MSLITPYQKKRDSHRDRVKDIRRDKLRDKVGTNIIKIKKNKNISLYSKN